MVAHGQPTPPPAGSPGSRNQGQALLFTRRGHGASRPGCRVHERAAATSHSWTFSDKGSLDQARRELGRAWTLGLDGDLTERPDDFVLVVRYQDRAALVFERWLRSAGLRAPQA